MDTEVKSKRSLVIAGLSEILEAEVNESTVLESLGNWDSMAVVMTVGLLDDACGVVVDGVALFKCKTVADILKLAEVEVAA